MSINLHQLLKAMIEKGSRPICTSPPDRRPSCGLDGHLAPLRVPPSPPSTRKQLCYSVLTDSRSSASRRTRSSTSRSGSRTWRASAQHLHAARCGRGRVPHDPLQDPHVPGAGPAPGGLRPLRQAARSDPRHGPNGSGKSTTLASMIDKVNTERHEHIVTIEDPIEYSTPTRVRGEPARGRRRHAELQAGPQVHPAPGPRRGADRRDARPGDIERP